METTRLCLYDISVTHPRDWSVYINPQKLMNFNQGALKLQKLDRTLTDISMSLKWFPLEGFDPDRYMDTLHTALQKKFKRKLHAFNCREMPLCGHAAKLAFFTYADNHSIYRVLRQDEEVAEMQVMLPCDTTGRIIIASVAAIADTMAQQIERFEGLLAQLACHPLDQDTSDSLNVA